MSEAFTRGVESAANSARRATPTPVGGPVADISALRVRLGDARKALWQRNLGAAERDVDRVLAGLDSGKHLTGVAAQELRTFEASAHSVHGQILAEGGGLSTTARGALDRAVNVFHLVLRGGPRNAQAYADHGAALHLLGMDEEAYRVLRAAGRYGDTSPYSARLLAGIMLDRGKADGARTLLESVNTAVPGDAQILSLLGRADLELGDRAAAQSHLHQAATAARQNGDLPRAAELFGQVVELAPEDADLRCALGDVLRLLGREDEALAAFDHALRLDPGHQRARIGKAGRVTRAR
jgi:Flp pilus assembly protein TadD